MVLLTIPALSLLFLQNRQVQTRLSKFVAERLSEELQTSISLSAINYSFFKMVQIQDLYVEDLHGDTLLYSELTKIRFKQFFSGQDGLEIKKITLENCCFNLVIDSSNEVNLTYFTDMLKNPHVPPEHKFGLHIARIEMINGSFSLRFRVRKESVDAVNFTDLYIGNLQIEVDDLISFQDSVEMDIISLTGLEKSGFEIGSLSSHLSLGQSHMHYKDLHIITESSKLDIPVLTFDFERFSDFNQFSRKVDLNFESRHSSLEVADLAYFVPAIGGMLEHIDVDGSVYGKLNDLKGDRVFMTFNQESTLAFDFVMIGLPQVGNTFMDFNFKELKTSVNSVHDLIMKIGDQGGNSLHPWINLGNLDFRGRFTGYPDNFVASGLLHSDLGGMVMDLSFKPDSLNSIKFNGHLRTNDFKLGEFLDQEKYLAELDMDVYTDGSLSMGQIEASLSGSIDSLEFFNYPYSNITLDGAFTNSTFEGGVSISDPNIKMDFEGRMDFSGEVPSYNFTADVARARPYFLKLENQDPNTFASFLIKTDITGKSIDELNGEVKLINSLFSRENTQVQVYDLNISTRNTPDSSMIKVRSQMFDGIIEGQYKLSTLPSSIRNFMDQYMDVTPGQEPFADSLTHFTYQFDFKHANPLFNFFYPNLQVGDKSYISGTFDPSRKVCSISGSFTDLQFRKNVWTNVELVTETGEDNLQVNFRSDSMNYGKSLALEDHQFQLKAANDSVHLEMSWDNQVGSSYKGNLNLTGTFQSDSAHHRGFLIDIHPTDLYINSEVWNLSSASVFVNKQSVRFDSLRLSSADKYLLADGYISAQEDQVFDLEVNKMNLHDLSTLAGLNAELTGNLTGNINFQQLEGNPYIFSDLKVDTLIFNDQVLGTTSFNADWDDSKRMINVQLKSETGKSRILNIDGAFSPESKMMDFDIHLNGIELYVLSPYAKSFVHNLGGRANVDLTLDGTLEKPTFNGNIGLDYGEATIAILNAHYIFNDQIRVYNNNLYLEEFIAADELGNGARISGTMTNTYLKDFFTNINIEIDHLMCMNTSSIDNEAIYGSIFATGNVGINGRFDAIRIDVKATTERNTAIYLPLYMAREVQTSDFISFVIQDDEKEDESLEETRKIGGLEMILDLNVTEDAMVQMIFDPKLGDIIETSGRGNLRIQFDEINGLKMFGDVELRKGEYLFTLQNVINKRFLIEPGGKIKFEGSPTDASIDLEAIYTTRTAPYNLYPGDPSEEESLKKRIPVECRLNLQGKLQSPTIVTGIGMPTADPLTLDLLENATSTEEELMKQFLSLLVINNFYSVSQYSGSDNVAVNSNVAGVTASELLSNQLTNWLSQISDDFNIGVNYRPGDQVTSDEVQLALSTQLLDDRIIISGNVDVGGQEANPSSGAANNPYIVGDFDVEFKLNDNVSLIAFNRARDELLYETAPYKQGVGVSYREEFNNFSHLWNRYKEGLTNRKTKKKKKKSEEAESEN